MEGNCMGLGVGAPHNVFLCSEQLGQALEVIDAHGGDEVVSHSCAYAAYDSEQ